MSTTRPENIDPGRHTSDDGLFGPESVSWRSLAHPATGIGAGTAALIQMLYPPVMYVVDQASSFRENPERRAQRTGDYATTITYGDVEAAEAAGETLRRIHARCKGADPDTGEAIAADDEPLLVWVNNALTWALLRAWQTYGPELSPTERDRFVTEQKISARLVGCDPDAVASNVAELEAYMTSMEPKLAKTTPCIWFKETMAAPSGTGGMPAAALKALTVQSSVSLMGHKHRALYGYPWGPIRERIVVGSTKALLGSLSDKLPFEAAIGALREHVDTHAFGARRRREVVVPAAS